MPLFRKPKKPVEGLEDLPTEDDAGSSMDSSNNKSSNNKENNDNPASEEDDPQLRGTRQKVRNSKDHTRTHSTRLQEAEIRRNQMKEARQLSSQSIEEDEEQEDSSTSIETLLGVDEKGCCLRHPLFLIRTGDIVANKNRFETILDCKLCRQDFLTVQQELKARSSRSSSINAAGQVTTKRISKRSSNWKEQKKSGNLHE